MIFEETDIQNLFLIKSQHLSDERGFFKEIFRSNTYEDQGIDDNFVQENHSSSSKGVMRGMHYQCNHPQGQLVTVFHGKILEVVVDLRRESESYLNSFSIVLSSEDQFNQIYTPPGVAGGYCVLSERADLHYKVTEYYDHEDERGLNCFDPLLANYWKNVESICLRNKRDEDFPLLEEIKLEDFPNA